ncbi:MAG TPA: hypothetical protein VH475_17045 [Tepidisphaeraceae bacterium]
MTATGMLHAVTTRFDALCHGRVASVPHPPAPTPAAVDMTCPRCGDHVKATFPPDEGEELAFECGRCGIVAYWV